MRLRGDYASSLECNKTSSWPLPGSDANNPITVLRIIAGIKYTPECRLNRKLEVITSGYILYYVSKVHQCSNWESKVDLSLEAYVV